MWDTLFCSLEKNFSAQKYISRLKVKRDGVEVTLKDQNEIGEETQKFYKDLFSNKDDPDKVGEIGSFLNEGETNYPKLTEAEAEAIEGHLTADELLRTLKNTKNDTAPGSSGFTYSFYKIFWRNISALEQRRMYSTTLIRIRKWDYYSSLISRRHLTRSVSSIYSEC